MLFRLLYTLYFLFLFSIILALTYPFGLIITIPLSKRRKLLVWQQLGQWCLSVILALSGMRFTVLHRDRIPKHGKLIFAANHESLLDGPILSLLIGGPNIAITAPRKSFPWIWRVWMTKMGFIEVARDLFEQLRFPEALHGDVAVNKAAELLNTGLPLMIYPEGHREFHHHLLPFHTGVIRVAMKAQATIIPVALSGVDRLWPPESLLLRPGHAVALIGLPVAPLKKTASKKEVIDGLEDLEQRMSRLLPKRYVPEHFLTSHHHQPVGRVGAFFDLDRTLLPGNAAQLVTLQFYQHHLLSPRYTLRVAWWLFLEKIGHLNHFLAMTRAVKSMAGWNVVETKEQVDVAYQNRVRHHLIPEMRALIEHHRRLGHLLFLVTEEIDAIANAASRDLRMTAVAATELETRQGTYTGQLKGPLMYRVAKAQAIKRFANQYGIDLTHSFAYADSLYDLPMLEAVGHPVAVNPHTNLLAVAKKNDWKVVHY